eukprot:TRINITY_DN1075_c0_g1_i9.p1 TRINITY_DN1075_c0_g1~~TRINITY_DN1075_c0_g1_i9.p1  ORF type:complete len:233 (-),score=39.97 TRINITY_DN1075_c0_g1_i9:104-772(-)
MGAEGKMEVSDEKQEVNEAMNSVPSTVNFYMPHVEQYPVGPKLRVGLIVAVQPNEQQKKRTEEFWLAKFVMWKIEHDAVTNQKKVLFKVAWLENNGKGTYRPAKNSRGHSHCDLIPSGSVFFWFDGLTSANKISQSHLRELKARLAHARSNYSSSDSDNSPLKSSKRVLHDDPRLHTDEQELFDLIPITKAPGNLSDAEEDDCAERASDDEAEQKYFADLVA